VPQPAPPGAEGPADFQVTLTMVKVEGGAQSPQPGAPTTVFGQNEIVGAFGTLVVVQGTQEALFVFARVEGQTTTPVANPKREQISEAQQGAKFFFWLQAPLPPGDYAFGVFRDRDGALELVSARNFQVQ